MRARYLALAGLALAATGCGRSDDSNTAATPPADAPPAAAPVAAPPATTTDFARPINALGNEPFWSVQIRPDGLTFSAPDRQDLRAPNPGPQVQGVEAVWAAPPLRAVLRAEVCQDGMSGFSYPFTATVEVEGMTLKGCAAYADAMPRE